MFVTFVNCLGYCVLIPQLLEPVVSEIFDIDCDSKCIGSVHFRIHWICIFVVSPFILYPLCLLRDLKFLKYSSAIGCAATFYCVGLLVYEAILHFKMENGPGTLSLSTAEFLTDDWSVSIFIVINVAAKAYNCHFALPPIYGSLRNRSIKRMGIVMIVSYSFVLAVYVVFGVCGYYLFGSDSKANILNNFNGEAGAAVVVARVAIALSLIGSFPLSFRAGMNALEYQFFSDPDTRCSFEENPRCRWIAITVILILLTLISLPLDDIGQLAPIHGAVSVLLVICAFPIMIYCKIRFGEKSTSLDDQGAVQQLEMANYRQMQDEEKVSHGMPSGPSSNDSQSAIWSFVKNWAKDQSIFVQKMNLGTFFVFGILLGVAGITESLLILVGREPLLCYF